MIFHTEQHPASIFWRRTTLVKSMTIINLILTLGMLICCISLLNHGVLGISLVISAIVCLAICVLYFKRVTDCPKNNLRLIILESLLPYIALLAGALPCFLLCLTHGNLAIISEYGLTGISVLFSDFSLKIPIAFILLISACYWFEIMAIHKENTLLFKCNEFKKSLWE